MAYLLLTILLNTLIFILFKLFPKYKIDALQAIVVNYFTCVATGSIFIGRFPIHTNSLEQPWFIPALLMGVFFISIFNFIAYCTRRFGITTSTVSNKLSLVIPVVFSVMLYSERLSVINIAGILLAFPAVYFSTKVKEASAGSKQLLLPALLFLCSGMLDTVMKYVEHTYLADTATQAVFPVHVFGVAAIIGTVLVIILTVRKKIHLHYRNIIAGILLGIPNYFSIYYLIRLLNSDWLQSSAAIPVNNIGIVLACALTAILFFKEPFSKQRIAGICFLSLLSFLLLCNALCRNINTGHWNGQ